MTVALVSFSFIRHDSRETFVRVSHDIRRNVALFYFLAR